MFVTQTHTCIRFCHIFTKFGNFLQNTILKNRIVEGCEIEAGGRSFTELEKRRDRCLAGIQQVLAEHWYPQDKDGWPEME